MKNKKILVLAKESRSTKILLGALDNQFNIDKIILEKGVSSKTFIKRRIKKLGLIKVIGQVIFLAISKAIIRGEERINTILNENGLAIKELDEQKILRVGNINDEKVIQSINNCKPDLILVNGTGIIKKKLLQTCSCPIINTHTGITPLYRGVHGGYWALVNQDRKNCGVTVHLIDKGIDTGGIIEQRNIEINSSDNYFTYPIKQLIAGIEILQEQIPKILKGNISLIESPKGNSRLWSHPTIWEYIYNRFAKGVK